MLGRCADLSRPEVFVRCTAPMCEYGHTWLLAWLRVHCGCREQGRLFRGFLFGPVDTCLRVCRFCSSRPHAQDASEALSPEALPREVLS